MVFRRIFAHISHFFRLRGPCAPVALSTTDAEPLINALIDFRAIFSPVLVSIFLVGLGSRVSGGVQYSRTPRHLLGGTRHPRDTTGQEHFPFYTWDSTASCGPRHSIHGLLPGTGCFTRDPATTGRPSIVIRVDLRSQHLLLLLVVRVCCVLCTRGTTPPQDPIFE